jgi:hypothetical protein
LRGHVGGITTLVLGLIVQVAVSVYANSFSTPKGLMAKAIVAIVVVVAAIVVYRIPAGRRARVARRNFDADLSSLFREVEFSTRAELASKVQARLHTSTSLLLEKRIESVLNGLSFPDWNLAEAIVESCADYAHENNVGISATRLDVSEWKQRYNHALNPPSSRKEIYVSLAGGVAAVAVAVIASAVDGSASDEPKATGHDAQKASSSPSDTSDVSPGATAHTGASASVRITYQIDPTQWAPEPVRGITLTAGEHVRIIEQSGGWRCASEEESPVATGLRGDPAHAKYEGPDDRKNFMVPYHDICLLIGRIGNGQWFDLGSQEIGKIIDFTAPRDGQLQLTVNEIRPDSCLYPTPGPLPNYSCYQDNTGSVTVEIDVAS